MVSKSSVIKFLAIAVNLVVLTALITSGISLGAATTKTLSTNYTLVNLGSADATVNVQYLKEDGSVWDADPANESFIVPADFGMVQVRQYFDSTLAAGRGSVVVSSDQPLAGVSQIQARNQVPTQGAYSAITQGSNSFYVPLAARRQPTLSGIFNSLIVIQNTDSVALNVSVALVKGSSTTYTKPINNLLPGQAFYYDLETETNLPEPWIGSAVVTAANSGNIAVVTNSFSGPDGLQTFNAFPAESIGPNWMVPLFFSRLNNGLSTVVTVQNISGAQIPAGGITLSCIKDALTFPVGPATITVGLPSVLNVNESYSFNPVADAANFPNSHWGGSCQIDAGSSDVVAIVQMRITSGSAAGAAASYEAIPMNGSTNRTLVVPLVAKRLANGFASVVTIQNMNPNQPANDVELTYMPSFIAAECPVAICDKSGNGTVGAEDAVTIFLDLPAGGSLQQNHRIGGGAGAVPELPDGWQGSLVAVSSIQPIHGFVQLTNYLFGDGDRLMAHNAFSLP